MRTKAFKLLNFQSYLKMQISIVEFLQQTINLIKNHNNFQHVFLIIKLIKSNKHLVLSSCATLSKTKKSFLQIKFYKVCLLFFDAIFIMKTNKT